jgi:hypothetical protein
MTAESLRPKCLNPDQVTTIQDWTTNIDLTLSESILLFGLFTRTARYVYAKIFYFLFELKCMFSIKSDTNGVNFGPDIAARHNRLE